MPKIYVIVLDVNMFFCEEHMLLLVKNVLLDGCIKRCFAISPASVYKVYNGANRNGSWR